MSYFHERSTLAILLAATLLVSSLVQPQAGDVTLASAGEAKVTLSDYEASILAIPEKDRFGWAMSQERVSKWIENLLRVRSIANDARRQGLDADPVLKKRVDLYVDKLLAEAAVARVDAESTKEFEARRASNIERARELYLVNKQKYQTPAEVKVSHILVSTVGRTNEEAQAKVRSLREKVVAGASFEELAIANSEDASVKNNRGDLGYFAAGQMDPQFEAAAFAMKKPGELSEPVRSRFGYHLIRFEDKKEPHPISFEEAMPELLEKLKTDFLEAKRGLAYKATFDSARVQWNEPAVIGLRKQVDPALLKVPSQ